MCPLSRLAWLASVLAVVALPLSIPASAAPDERSFTDDWNAVVREARAGRILRVASSRADDPACADALDILDAIPLLTGAIAAHAAGDGLRLVGDFERRLLCLNVASVDAIDSVLAVYTYHSLHSERPGDSYALTHALFQLGALTADQTAPPRPSAWRAMIADQRKPLAEALKTYPNELGLWAYELNSGLLFRLPYRDAAGLVMDWLARNKAADADCFLAELQPAARTTAARNDPALACPRGARALEGDRSSGRASQTTHSLGGPDMASEDLLGCVVAATAAEGPRGQLTCVRQAAGVETDVHELLTLGSDDFGGLPDKLCVGVGDEAAGGASGGSGTGETSSSSSTGSSGASGTAGTSGAPGSSGSTGSSGSSGTSGSGSGSSTSGSGSGSGSSSPSGSGSGSGGGSGSVSGPSSSSSSGAGGGGGSETGGAGGGSGTGGAGGGAEGGPGGSENSMSWWTAIKYWASGGQTFQVETERAACCRGQPVDKESATDACSDRSSAAARVGAAYACLVGDTQRESLAEHGGLDPTLTLTTDPNGRMPARAACLDQGGDSVRRSPDDVSCGVARCVPGESCVCNRLQRDPTELAAVIAQQQNVCRETAYCTGDEPCACNTIAPDPTAFTGGPGPSPVPPVPAGRTLQTPGPTLRTLQTPEPTLRGPQTPVPGNRTPQAPGRPAEPVP